MNKKDSKNIKTMSPLQIVDYVEKKSGSMLDDLARIAYIRAKNSKQRGKFVHAGINDF